MRSVIIYIHNQKHNSHETLGVGIGNRHRIELYAVVLLLLLVNISQAFLHQRNPHKISYE